MADQQTHINLELNALLDTTRVLIESNDLEFVVNHLMLILMGKLLVTRAAVVLYRPLSDDYEVFSVKGKILIKKGDVFSLPISEEQRDRFYLQADELSQEYVPPALGNSNLCTLFALQTNELHLGYLLLGSKFNQQDYSETELKLVEGMCTISSAGIANSQLVGELKNINRKLDRKIHELNTLFDLSKEFSTLVDRDKIVRMFKFALLGEMMVHSFFFLHMKEGKPIMVTKSSVKHDPSEDDIKKLFALKASVLSVDDALRQEIPFLANNPIALLATLSLSSEKLAVVGIGNRPNGEDFTDSDHDFLLSLGSLVLLSIQKTYLVEERIQRKSLEDEIRLSREIQLGLLPANLPQPEGYALAASNIPSRQVGGDYFDVIDRGDELIVAIADVTGKGVPASLLMANVQAMLHALILDDFNMAEVTEKINDILYKNTAADKFITFFWGRLKLETGEFEYVNAGHNPPYYAKKDGSVAELHEGGLLLGAMPSMMPYRSGKLNMERGDRIVLFTDGVTEATSADGSMYEEPRLLDLMKRSAFDSAQHMLDSLIVELEQFTSSKFSDDVTVVILDRT